MQISAGEPATRTGEATASSPSSAVHRFGSFVLDPTRRLLLRNGEAVEVSPRALDTLVALVERAGEDVTREELLDAVWGDLHVTDANLTQSVSVLRKVLGDSTRRPRYIATVPRRGYRFVAPVVQEDAPAGVEPALRATPSGLTRSRGRVRWLAVAVLVGTMPGFALWIAQHALAGRGETPPPPAATLASPSVAILPFLALSPKAEAGEVLTVGTAARLIDHLERYPELTVRPLRSVRAWSGPRDPAAVGRLLDVAAVVDGDVGVEEGRLVATVRLVEAEGGEVVWRDRLELEPDEGALLPESILRSLAPALGLEAPESTARLVPTAHPEAYAAFLKGLYHLEGRVEFAEAGRWFGRAVELDPTFAEAWAGAAAVAMFVDPSPTRGEDLALRAVELDPRSGEAWAVLGFHRSIRQWRWARAGADLRRAISLEPGLSIAHHWYAYHLASQGRAEEALASIRRAREIDPLSPILNADVGHLLVVAGRHHEAIDELERAIELDPGFTATYQYLGEAYRIAGRYREAIVALERAITPPYEPMVGSMLASVYYLAGEEEAAREIEGALPYQSGARVRVLVASGRIDEAVEAAGRACRRRDAGIYLLLADPTFDPLRRHPAYPELLSCMGFAPQADPSFS